MISKPKLTIKSVCVRISLFSYVRFSYSNLCETKSNIVPRAAITQWHTRHVPRPGFWRARKIYSCAWASKCLKTTLIVHNSVPNYFSYLITKTRTVGLYILLVCYKDISGALFHFQ